MSASLLLRVTGLHRYPVKSCAGLSVAEAMLVNTGLDVDRTWMVVDAHHRADSRLQGASTFGMNALIVTGVGRQLRVAQTGTASYRFN